MHTRSHKAIIPLLCVFAYAHARAPFVQDIGGSLAFQGQDIVGGAAIIFKPPQRVRDLTGGAAAVMKRPARSSRPSTQVARNSGRPRPPTQPTSTDTTTPSTDRAEALKAQGNTYYDQGQYAKALEAYQSALKLDPRDA